MSELDGLAQLKDLSFSLNGGEIFPPQMKIYSFLRSRRSQTRRYILHDYSNVENSLAPSAPRSHSLPRRNKNMNQILDQSHRITPSESRTSAHDRLSVHNYCTTFISPFSSSSSSSQNRRVCASCEIVFHFMQAHILAHRLFHHRKIKCLSARPFKQQSAYMKSIFFVCAHSRPVYSIVALWDLILHTLSLSLTLAHRKCSRSVGCIIRFNNHIHEKKVKISFCIWRD